MATKSMEHSSSPPISSDQAGDVKSPPEVETAAEPVKRSHYFINEIVEDQLRNYIWTGCTSVRLRDQIMQHATELIRQIIRKQGLHTIYPGQEESAFGDLLQTAWVQIERTLYKFRARPHCRVCYNSDRPTDSLLYNPGDLEYGIITYTDLFKHLAKIGKRATCPHCDTRLSNKPVVIAEQDLYGGSETVLYRGPSKVFNMWSQIARTVILAYIKKEGRDRKNCSAYRDHCDHRPRQIPERMLRFLTEARVICKYNDDHLLLLDVLEQLQLQDAKPWDGIIGKLVDKSGLSRTTVTNFMKLIRLRSFEFTDSPINRSQDNPYKPRRQQPGEADED